MLQVAICSRYPLYRQAIIQILQASAVQLNCHELEVGSVRGADTERVKRLAQVALVIVLDDGAKELVAQLAQVCPRQQVRLLFSEVYGSFHRQLIRRGRFHAVLPMNSSVEAVRTLLHALVPVLASSSVGAAICLCRRTQVEPGFAPDLDDLTHNEQLVLRSICKGLRNDAISNELGVTLSSVKASIARIRRKLGLNSRHHAISLCARQLT